MKSKLPQKQKKIIVAFALNQIPVLKPAGGHIE
jgi:hypothetical protein